MNSPAAIALFAPLLICGLALGSEPITDPDEVQEIVVDTKATNGSNSGFVFEANLHTTLASDADFDTDIGEFAYAELRAGINASREVGDSGMFSVDFNAGLINYDITPSATSAAGDAASIGAEFDDVTTLSLIGMYANQTDEGHTWFIGGGVLSNGENGADFGDTVDGIFLGGYRHKLSDNLQVGLGITVRSRLDDDVLVVPLPQVKYTVNKFWSIESEGVGLRLNYKASDDLNYGIIGQYASTTFRLDDTHAAAPEGMVTHRRIPVAFYARYAPNDTIEISGRVGGMLSGELEILDTNGNDITSQDIDTGIFGSITVSFKF